MEEAFEKLMEGELGASFVVWKDGEEVKSCHGGWRDRNESEEWTEETMVPVWSATKGPMAVSVLLALERAGLGAEDLVRRVWPELRVGEASFGELFSHQCGLAALDEVVSIWDREAVIGALERQVPRWEPGRHGYHPRTIGFLADEVVRRVDGRSLGEFWWEEVAELLEIDFWIGCPGIEQGRVAELVPARASAGGEPKEFYRALLTKGSVTRQAFSSPGGLSGVNEMNSARAWEAGFPAMGGVASARGLAKFYDHVLWHELFEGIRGELMTKRISGLDEVQRIETSFAFGMMMGKFGESERAFGHPGAGGSYGFADPERGMGVGFVMNRFEANLFPSEERLELSKFEI